MGSSVACNYSNPCRRRSCCYRMIALGLLESSEVEWGQCNKYWVSTVNATMVVGVAGLSVSDL